MSPNCALSRKIFGDKSPIINSTKSQTGHSLGATGAQEAIYSLLMMENNFVSASINIDGTGSRSCRS
jgi:3-oxoacyl-[acyl-carrier-protein] synthase I